jgi:hypothetical protein
VKFLGRRRRGFDVPLVQVPDGIDIACMHRVDCLPFPCEYGSAYSDDELLVGGEGGKMSHPAHAPHSSCGPPDISALSAQDLNSQFSASLTVLQDDGVIHADL